MPNQNLGLNQALLIVNKINLPTSSLKVLYQTNECYGCPLIELTPTQPGRANASITDQLMTDSSHQFIMDTKYNFQFELRQQNESIDNSAGWCRLLNVALNTQGVYQVDASPRGGAELTDGQTLLCSLKTRDSGECLLCPFAIIACLLFAIVGFEQLYAKFWPARRERDYLRASDRKLSSQVGGGGEGNDESAIQCQTVNAEDRDSTGSSSSSSQDQQQQRVMAANGPLQTTRSRRHRIECLDTFRGLTLAGMIFVNYGGAGYAMWEHTPWDGITPADFVFPFFIFSMGASVAISVRSSVKRHPKSLGHLAIKIIKRSTLLGLIGVCLNSKWINNEQANGLAHLRITGVLQRFSISYLIIAFMYTIELILNEWIRAQSLSQVPYLSKLVAIILELLTAINYLAIHVYLTYFYEYDANCPVGYTGPGGQTEGGRYAACTGGAAAWLDRLVLGENHTYNDHEVKQIFMTKVSHDPEGILGYTTSILLTLIGLQCGKILIGSKTHKQKLLALAQWSLALVLASSLVVFIPINKRMWSLTFVIVTGLLAFITITLLYLVIDVYGCKKTFLLRLVSSAGKNSIFLYVGHSLISSMLPWWFPIADQASHLQLLLRLSWATFVWLLIAHYMALKGLFVKI